MNWLVFGGSLAAILALAGLARALGLGAAVPLDEATAKQEAELALAGFEATGAELSADGLSARVTGRDGVALVRAHGAHYVVSRETA